jgi:2-polyprenyl-3-methyl-5-hydroxy-6-metoxy-1,4-benzoquinol methylase
MANYICNYCNSKSSKELYGGIKDWEYGVKGEYAYHECSDCGGVQLHPFPSIEDLVESYNIDYHGYVDSGTQGLLFNILFKLKEAPINNQLKKLMPKDARVLDIGCGAGMFLQKMRNLGAKECVGIDFSETAIKQLKMKGFQGFQGTYESFQQDDGYYDIIVMNNYLEHTLDPNFELNKTRKLLKVGGILIGELPGYDSYEREIFGKYWGGNHVPRHTYQFNQKFLVKKLREAGFKNIRIKHELNTGHLALSVQNWMQRTKKDLRNNSNIKHGRSKWYSLLLILFIPFNILPLLLNKSGVTKFYAETE